MAMPLFFVTQLLDTKSTDRKMTLLHYIALIVKEKYAELANFYNELHFVDKAAAGEFVQNKNLKLIFRKHVKMQHVTEKWGTLTSFYIRKSMNKTYCLLTVCEVSLENVLLDVRELGKGMDLIRRECSLHDHSVLKDFVQSSDTQLDKLQKDAKAAEVSNSALTS